MSSTLSEYQALKSVLYASLDALESAMHAERLPEFQVTKAELHPSDAPDFVPSEDMFVARRNVLGAMEMLTAAIQNPADAANEHSWSHWLEVAIQLASRTNVFDHVIRAGPSGAPLAHLSAAVGMEERKLGKLLRLLAAHYYLIEVEEGRFAVARRGLLFSEESPTRAFAAWQSWFSFRHSLECLETWLDPTRTSSWRPLDTPAAIAFDWQAKGCAEMWDWAAQFHPDELKHFTDAMHAIPISAVTNDYDWSSLPMDALIVDVAGGSGHVTLDILSKYPHFRAVVQDRPEVRQFAEATFAEKLPHLSTQPGRLTFEEIDFFHAQPRLHADVYILRFIVHDLEDDRATIVLRNIAKAMAPHSKLLAIDFVLSPAVVSGSTNASKSDDGHLKLPFPLLETFTAPKMVLQADIEMSAAIGGTERTKKQSSELFRRAGLKVNRHIHTRGPFGIHELVLQ